MKTELKTHDTAAANVRWHGAIDGIYKQLVYGWACDEDHPDARVIVEICRDEVPIGCVIAEMARTDLITQFDTLGASDPCHGFVADIGTLLTSADGIISARVANTPVTLEGSVSLSENNVPPAAAVNTVVGDGGLRLHGWAFDPTDPKRTLTVRAYLGNEVVAQATANIIHPSMRGHIEGLHGFDLSLPTVLADGQMHSVRVVDDEGRPLNGSPLTICCSLDGLIGLLPDDADELLLKVADIYQRHLPRSLPMSAWQEWSARFDNEEPVTTSRLTTGVIVTGTVDAVSLERTISSVQAQHSLTVKVFAYEPFSTMLANALASDCDVICCIRAGDTLVQNGLSFALEAFALPKTQIAYSDSELNGCPWFKPMWDSDYAFASDYPLDLLLVHRKVAQELINLETPADFAWSALAAAHIEDQDSIAHIPRVLYRMQTPLNNNERFERANAASRALITMHPGATLINLEVPGAQFSHAARRVAYAMPQGAIDKKVSLIIPTRDRVDLLQRCISTIQKYTKWPSLEIIIIDNGSVEDATHTYFKELEQQAVRILPMPGPFNYADLNNRAIAQATGEFIGLINNDIEALHHGWLDEIITQLSRPEVGAVGAKLLWPNGMVQHGGVLLGVGNIAGHYGNRLFDSDWGDYGRNQLVQQVSGCTAACLFLRRVDFLELGGMDPIAFPVAFNDVDLCLKVRASGKAIVWTPHAKLLHAESASRGHEDTPQKKSRAQREVDQLRYKWGNVLADDPAYNPNLNLDPNSHAYGGLAIPPRNRAPRNGNIFIKSNLIK